MKDERYIEILAEVCHLKSDYLEGCENDYSITLIETLTAMTRAVEEETARLRECEAIVRELAQTGLITHYMDYIAKARQWVRENPE